VSAIGHLSIVALLILSTEVHPFGAVPTESIAVDLVPKVEADNKPESAKKPEPSPTPALQLPSLDFSAAAAQAQDAKPQAASQPPQNPNASSERRSVPQPQSQAQAPAHALAQIQAQAQAAASASSSPGYRPPEPDLTVKYNVMLGLPEELPLPLPPPPPSGAKPGDGDGVDARASTASDLSSSLVTQFRRHLKTCSRLPASVARSDNVMIKLRVLMASDGRLAAEPILIEASASAKGPLLMQSAISALQACQPYGMLPRDRYGEWKVIDLTFTPQDFG